MHIDMFICICINVYIFRSFFYFFLSSAGLVKFFISFLLLFVVLILS